jgi:hypothetical protein
MRVPEMTPEIHKRTPSGPTPTPLPPQPSTSRGRPLFATVGRQNEEIEASLENFKDPAPEREPRDQGPYLMGDETDIPYASDPSDYIDRQLLYPQRLQSPPSSPKEERQIVDQQREQLKKKEF